MIVFAWDGFPQYAARCIVAFVKSTDEQVVVVATRPAVPIEGMDALCGTKVLWIGYDESRSLLDMLGEIPRLLIVSGWGISVFNHFRDEVRLSGGKVVAMCDNNWTGFTLKELIKAIRFRFMIRDKYHGFFVPGKSGIELLKFYGVDERIIATGLYTADSSLFSNGKPLAMREKRIIYVGRFVPYKNALRMVEAFAVAAGAVDAKWTLDLYGCGPLRSELDELIAAVNASLAHNGSRVECHDFLQPEELAVMYREARIFCLPSISEHWGLVVHEAALSGCVLLLGDKTGAADDLLGKGNGIAFNPSSVEAIEAAFRNAMSMDDCELANAQAESIDLASRIHMQKFVDSVSRFAL